MFGSHFAPQLSTTVAWPRSGWLAGRLGRGYAIRLMLMNKLSLRGIVLAGLAASVPMSAFGLASRIPNQDPEAIARGNAFVATADNPSAIYYNPAGIAQLDGTYAQAGLLSYLNIYADYEAPSGQKYENDHKIVPVPSFDCTYALKDDPFTFGFGVYAPFGLGMEWPENVPFRDAGIEAEITYITMNPVVSWRARTNLSFAIGPTINYSSAKLRQGITGLPAPYQYQFDGDDVAFGFNGGVLWQPFDQWSFGAKYFSATTFRYEGSSTFSPAAPGLPPSGNTTADLKYPQMVAAGISFRPTPLWNIEVDIDWTDWDRVKNAVFAGVGTLTLNFESSFFYEAGVTRQLGKGYYASAGYFYSEASTRSSYYTPLVPDTNLHVGSVGVGRKGTHWDWAFALQIIGGAYRDVTDAANASVDGRYRLFTPTLSGSIAYHF